MKKLLLVFVGLLCSLVISAQTNFQELSLEKAREQARAENKPIFLDCYTNSSASGLTIGPPADRL